MPTLETPEDKTITTLYLGNLGTLTESDLRLDDINKLFGGWLIFNWFQGSLLSIRRNSFCQFGP